MYKSGTPRGLSLSLSLACSLPLALLQSKREAPTPKEETPDFTLQNNSNLIVGGTAPGTHHPGEGLVLQEQSSEVRRTCIKVTTWGSDQAPSSDATKRSKPAPSASACSFLHLDTLSSNSTGSLREQLCLVNHRIDDVRRTLRTKDEHAEGPLRGSPFVQKIQDAPIPLHFCLPMLEAYDGSSDPTEHVVAFHAQMTLTRPKPTTASLHEMRQKEEEHHGQYLAHFTVEYVAVKTLVAEKHEDHKRPQAKPSRGPPYGLPRRRMERGKLTVPRPSNVSLNSTRTEIFLQIREKELLKTPNLLRSRAEDRDRRRYLESNYVTLF
ncbi:hypothetical protein B296_00006318 [Ensete ventricosum]|uniref:Uncharacterized protein n=1 Tax=Ensete ventricosum TaxID=4639 RepID=A0A427A3R9_ENSVE|nr:hypothetical protein B296_00006318 [Ensete ventricosum]